MISMPARKEGEYGLRDLPPCRQHRAACLGYGGRGRCKILTDTNFGRKSCPFYKTTAMVTAQLRAAEERKVSHERNYHD